MSAHSEPLQLCLMNLSQSANALSRWLSTSTKRVALELHNPSKWMRTARFLFSLSSGRLRDAVEHAWLTVARKFATEPRIVPSRSHALAAIGTHRRLASFTASAFDQAMPANTETKNWPDAQIARTTALLNFGAEIDRSTGSTPKIMAKKTRTKKAERARMKARILRLETDLAPLSDMDTPFECKSDGLRRS